MLSSEGTVIQARDAMYQAVFPLRGKPLNAEKATEVDVFNNKEFAALITALGCGIKEDYDEKKLKYNKVILLSDADVDKYGHMCINACI